MGRVSFGGSTGTVDHPAGWNEEAVGGGRGNESERYAGLGAAAAKRQAYQVDFGKANANEQQGLQARGQQEAGLNGMRQAAMGNAPSQAAILGGQVGGQSLDARMQATAGAKGLGYAAANQQAAQQQSGMQQAGMQQYTGMRGSEMLHAQGAFGQGANQMRQGDYVQQNMAQQQAEAQARSEMAQRELNQSAQMDYERMGVRGNLAQSEGELRQKGIASKENNTRDTAHDQESNRFMNYAKGATKAVASWFTSDENAKQNVKPLTGLAGVYAHLRDMQRDQEQGGADPQDVYAIRGIDGEAKGRRDLHRAMEESGEGARPYAVEREPATLTPGKPAAGYHADRAGKVGDVTGKGPEASYDLGFGAGPSGQAPSTDNAPGTSDFDRYGEAVDRKVMLSDDKTKLAKAWEEGHKAAVNDVQTMRQKSPDELKALGAKGNSLANALRGAKADAYDQARGVPQHIMTVPPELQKPPEVQPSGMLHQQPAAPVRNAAVDHVERETPDTRPDYQKLANQTLFGAPSNVALSDDQTAHMGSDEKMKQGAHAEGEMGRALEQGYKPYEYEYKPEFAGREGQRQGEKNVGPMAQDMAKNPITGNAVEKGPDGLLRISIPKTVKTNSAGIGYLAAKVRELETRMKEGK